MSINHIGTNELDGNFKTLKINNQVVSLPITEIYPFTGNFGVQAERYLQPYSGNGTSTNGILNQISSYKPIKITGMICRKNNPTPTTDFILFKSDITLQNFVNLQTVQIPAGSQLGTSPVLNIAISSSELLFCRTTSSGSGNPQEVQVVVQFEQQ